MTISSTTSRVDYVGTGTAGPFAYPFKVFAATDLSVTKRDASSGAEATLNYPTDFTATGVGNAAGGSIKLTAALALGDTLTIRRVVPLTQPTSLRNAGTFFPATHEDAFDRLVMIDQQQQDAIDRSMRLPVTVDPGAVSVELPVPETGRALFWKTDGSGLENRPVDNSAIALPGDSRTVTTVADYLDHNKVFNALDYGLLTTNTGTQNHTALTAAQTAATAASGGIIYVPAGTYEIDSDFLLKANTTLCGERYRTVLKYTGATAGKLVKIDAQDHVTVRDLKLDLNDASLPSYGVTIFGGSSYVTVDHVWVVNAGQYGIVVGDLATNGGSDGIEITNNLVDMTSAATDIANTPIGIEVFPRGGAGFYTDVGILIQGNTVKAGTACIAGIKINEQTGARVLGNLVDGPNNTDSNTSGSIVGGANRHCIIANNVVTNAKIGINFGGNLGADNGEPDSYISIHQNRVFGFNTYGIFASEGMVGLELDSNVLDKGSETPTAAIRMTPVAASYVDLIIRDNRLVGGGITLDAASGFDSTGASVTGNRIDDAAGNGIDAHGDDLDVSDNVIQSTNNSGIIVTGDRGRASRNVILDANQSNTAALVGLAFVGTDPTATENHIENLSGGGGHAKYGISINPGDRAILRDNRIVGMETGQVSYAGAPTTVWVQESERYLDPSAHTVGAVTTETTMGTYTLNAGDLSKYGGVKIRAAGTVSTNADNKTVKVYFGSAVLATMTSGNGTAANWLCEAEVFAAAGTANQRAIVKSWVGTTLTTNVATLSEDATAALTIKATGTKTGTTDVISETFFSVAVIH